jgi:hypothetical protein
MESCFQLYNSGIETILNHSLNYISINCTDAFSTAKTLYYLKDNVLWLFDDFYRSFCLEVKEGTGMGKCRTANVRIIEALCIKIQASKRMKLVYLYYLEKLPKDEIEYLLIIDRKFGEDIEKTIGYQIKNKPVFIFDNEIKSAYFNILKKIKIMEPMKYSSISLIEFKTFRDGSDYYYCKINNCFLKMITHLPVGNKREVQCRFVYGHMVELYQLTNDLMRFLELDLKVYTDSDIKVILDEAWFKNWPKVTIKLKATDDFHEIVRNEILTLDKLLHSKSTYRYNIFLRELEKKRHIHWDSKGDIYYFQNRSYSYIISFIVTFMYKLYLNIWLKAADKINVKVLLKILSDVQYIRKDQDSLNYFGLINSGNGVAISFLMPDERIKVLEDLDKLNKKLKNMFYERTNQ